VQIVFVYLLEHRVHATQGLISNPSENFPGGQAMQLAGVPLIALVEHGIEYSNPGGQAGHGEQPNTWPLISIHVIWLPEHPESCDPA
jgi:hypothetical protein